MENADYQGGNKSGTETRTPQFSVQQKNSPNLAISLGSSPLGSSPAANLTFTYFTEVLANYMPHLPYTVLSHV